MANLLGLSDGDGDDELAALARRIDVRRVADLSRLDALDVCVAAAIRAPFDPASISVCSGRGRTWSLARRRAIAEALERYCAEPRDRIAVVCAPTPPGPAVSVESLVPSRSRRDDELVEWVEGVSLVDGKSMWVPAAAVFYPYRGPVWFAPATHGLAAGETLPAATEAALLECVERDAYSRAVALATRGHGSACPPLGSEHLDADGRRWLDAAYAVGLRVLLRDVTGGTTIPTVLATVAEGDGAETWAHRGCSAARSVAAAATGALGEALQARLVDIQGAREDLPVQRVAAAAWFHRSDGEAPGSGPGPVLADDLVAETCARLMADGCGPPVMVDLSLTDMRWRAVRVVVPGLETWAFDASRVGRRLEVWCGAG